MIRQAISVVLVVVLVLSLGLALTSCRGGSGVGIYSDNSVGQDSGMLGGENNPVTTTSTIPAWIPPNSFVVYKNHGVVYLVDSNNNIHLIGDNGENCYGFEYVDFTHEKILYRTNPQLQEEQGQNELSDANYYSLISYNSEGVSKVLTGAAWLHRASGDTVIYLTDFASGASELVRNRGDKAEVVKERVYSDGISLSPDGNSLTYLDNSPYTSELSNGYYKIDDNAPALLGERCIPLAIANDGAFIYYVKYRYNSNKDRGYTLYVRSAQGDKQLIDEMEDYDYQNMQLMFNNDLSQVIIYVGERDNTPGTIYISENGMPAQQLFNGSLSQCWPLHIGYLNTLADERILVSSVHSFVDGVFRDDNSNYSREFYFGTPENNSGYYTSVEYSYYWLTKDDEWRLTPFLPNAGKVALSYSDVVFLNGRSLYRTKICENAQQNAREILNSIDMSMYSPILVSEDGNIIYFENDDGIFSLKIGSSEPNKVMDYEFCSYYLIPGTADCLIHCKPYLGDDELWVSNNGAQVEHISGCPNLGLIVLDYKRAFALCEAGEDMFDLYVIGEGGIVSQIAANIDRGFAPLGESQLDKLWWLQWGGMPE